MGCGASTLDPDRRPPRQGWIPPIVSRPFHGLRPWRNGNSQGCPPIQTEISTEVRAHILEARTSSVAPPETECRGKLGNEKDGVKIAHEKKPSIVEARTSSVTPLPETECRGKLGNEKDGVKIAHEKKPSIVEARTSSVTPLPETECRGKLGNEINDVKIGHEKKPSIDDERMRILSYASPSFRVYCRNSDVDHVLDLVTTEDLNGSIGATNDIVEGQGIISTNEESISSNEVTVKEPSKKRRKINVFKTKRIARPREANNSFSFANLMLCSSDNSPPLQKPPVAT